MKLEKRTRKVMAEVMEMLDWGGVKFDKSIPTD